MVERVARGSILAPAAAAIGVAALGMLKPMPAVAGPATTLQMRVQVVEACQIRLAPGGSLDELCGWNSEPPTMPSLEPKDFGAPPTIPKLPIAGQLPQKPSFSDMPMLQWPSVTTSPPTLPSAGFADANRRALGLAQQIAERVRYVTLTF